MADQFDAFQKEVEEDLQREKFQRFLKDNQNAILGAALAVVVGVGGWKLMEARRQSAAEAQSARFAAASRLIADNKAEDGQKALAALAASRDTYGALALLRLAGVEAAAGRRDEAVRHYDAVPSTSGVDPMLAGLARLQAAMLKADTADWTEMQNRLNDLAADSSPWRHNARELLGMAAVKAGKSDEARKEFERLLADRSTPQTIAERVNMMMAMLVQADLAKAQPATPATPAPSNDTPAKSEPAKTDKTGKKK